MGTLTIQCCCGGRVRCGDCRKDICYCDCHPFVDPTPQTREEVTAGWVNPSAAREAAWQEKQEAHA